MLRANTSFPSPDTQMRHRSKELQFSNALMLMLVYDGPPFCRLITEGLYRMFFWFHVIAISFGAGPRVNHESDARKRHEEHMANICPEMWWKETSELRYSYHHSPPPHYSYAPPPPASGAYAAQATSGGFTF